MRVDHEGLANDPQVKRIRAIERPAGHAFNIYKIGHVALRVADLERSVRFYVEVLGCDVVDVYPETMMPGGMTFLRLNGDHHGIALVGGAEAGPEGKAGLHHFAFEVGSLEEVVRARDHLREHAVPIDFEGRRRAGCQIAVEFRDPDGNHLEIYWGLDQIGTDGRARPPGQWREAFSLEDAIAEPPVGQDTTRHG